MSDDTPLIELVRRDIRAGDALFTMDARFLLAELVRLEAAEKVCKQVSKLLIDDSDVNDEWDRGYAAAGNMLRTALAEWEKVRDE